MTLLFVLLFGCIGRSAPLPAHPDGSLRTPVARLGLDSGDSTPDSVPESPDSTDTGDTGTVTLIYDTPDQTFGEIYGFGCGVSSGGDIDGDGYDDLVVGNAWMGSDPQFWVYAGSASGVLSESRQYSFGGSWREYYAAVSIAGDTNGDGYDDVLAGGSLFRGAAGGLETEASQGLESAVSNAAAGDVNGDGYADALIGDTDLLAGSDAGNLYIFDGGPDGMVEDASYRGAYDSDMGSGDHFGWAVAGGMDINGDGYSDVLGIGDSDVAVFYGAATGFAGGAASDGQNIGYCGRCDAHNAGDVDGDGYDEVAVWGQSVDLFHGSAGGIDLGAVDHRDGVFEAEPAGDVDRDGYADMLFLTSSGIGLFPGGPDGVAETALLELTTEDPVWRLTAGDVDADGIPDVLGGSPFGAVDPGCHGCVYVWLGSTITDPSRASTDTGGGDSGRDTHSGGDTHTGEDSDSGTPPDSDSPADSDHADSDTADTSAARKSGCGSGGGCDAAGGAFDPGGLLVLLVALTRRRPPRS